MKKLLLSFVAIFGLLSTTVDVPLTDISIDYSVVQAQTVTVDALEFPGTDGDYAQFSDINNVRTRSSNEWSFGLFVNVDDLSGPDQIIWQWKQNAGDQPNHAISFDTNSDRFCYTFNSNETACTASSLVVANTWYSLSLTYELSVDTIRLYQHDQSGALIGSATLVTTTSAFAHSQTQDTTIGAWELAGDFRGDFDGQMALFWHIYGARTDTTQLAAYALDPLNTGEAWLSSFGANFRMWFDDSMTCPSTCGTDRTGNSETITLIGGDVVLGTANGPTVAARPSGSGGNAASFRRRVE